jgi:hypothetical protein
VGIGATEVVVVHDEVGSCEGTALVTVSVRVCVTVTVFFSASSIIFAIPICFEVGDNDGSSTKPCVADATGPGAGRIYRLSAASDDDGDIHGLDLSGPKTAGSIQSEGRHSPTARIRGGMAAVVLHFNRHTDTRTSSSGRELPELSGT